MNEVWSVKSVKGEKMYSGSWLILSGLEMAIINEKKYQYSAS